MMMMMMMMMKKMTIMMAMIMMMMMVVAMMIMMMMAMVLVAMMIRFLSHDRHNCAPPVLASPGSAGFPALPSVGCAAYTTHVTVFWLSLFVSLMF